MPNGCRIALIEDNAVDRLIIKTCLRKEHNTCEVIEFDSSREAVDYFSSDKSEPVDLIVTDLNMPGKTGHDVIQAARANEEFSKVPIAVITSSNSELDMEQAERNGVDQYLTKPMTFEKARQILSLVKKKNKAG
jgi:CheY-like chemotaxis protein